MSEAICAVTAEQPAGLVPFGEADLGPRLVTGALAPDGSPGEADLLRLTPNDRDHWLVLAPSDALAPRRLRRVVEAHALTRPDVDVFYADDLALGEAALARRVRLKPAFDAALLAAQDYVGAPVIVRGAAFHRLGGLRPEMGAAAVYDLLLRAQALGAGIERIPQLLLAWPDRRPATPVEARRAALEAWIGTRPIEVAAGLTADTLQLRRRFDAFPEVTLVVPTRQSGPDGGEPYVVELLDSLARTDWPMDRLRVIVGDDSDRAERLAADRWPFVLARVPTPRPQGAPFNYAAKMNRLWRLAETEHLVLMNDDVQVGEPGWLKALMTFAMDGDVGGAGARLLFPDGRLQHAGVPGGLFGVAAHAWFGAGPGEAGYQDWPLTHREWSMLTGAVFATRRSVLEEANGFDERFTLEFNDLDLCLRLRILGYRIVYTPFAELTHREKASRGEAPPNTEEVAAFYNRWRELLEDDPAYHPALARDRFAITPRDDADTL